MLSPNSFAVPSACEPPIGIRQSTQNGGGGFFSILTPPPHLPLQPPPPFKKWVSSVGGGGSKGGPNRKLIARCNYWTNGTVIDEYTHTTDYAGRLHRLEPCPSTHQSVCTHLWTISPTRTRCGCSWTFRRTLRCSWIMYHNFVLFVHPVRSNRLHWSGSCTTVSFSPAKPGSASQGCMLLSCCWLAVDLYRPLRWCTCILFFGSQWTPSETLFLDGQ